MQRDVDAVHRRAAHQPDGAQKATLRSLCLNSAPDLLHQRHETGDKSRHMSAYKSDFLRVLAERGFIHQVSEPEALDALAEFGGHRLYRLRLHRALAAYRLAAADHDAALDAADRPPADRADGRRHDARRRPLRQGREPQNPDRRDDQPEPERHPRDLLEDSSNSATARATPSWPTMPTG